ICSAAGVRLKAWRIKQTSAKDFSFSRRIVPRNQQFLVDHLQAQAPLVCENSFTVAQNMPVYMQFTALNHTMAIFCNDRQVGFFPQGGGGFGDVLLAGEIKKGSNNIRLLIWADVAPKDLSEAFHLYRLEDNLTAASEWRFRPWTLPNATVGNGSKGAPTWYLATFKSPKVDQPLFLAMAGANKGQIYLNSHNVGRFWSAGPQEHYYLPECWFREVNELLVFDETGSQPVSTKLQFKPLGPYAGE
ncbi:MAG: hypothetical protein HQ546_10145, partial [Planctomycetes bacterium]|nr:hypothetical protein [Planctomycetota bacterium]